MSTHRSALLVALCVALLCASPGRAQQPPAPPKADEPPSVALPELRVPGLLETGYVVREATTATKSETPLIETPATVSVINRRQLDAQQLLTLPESLQWVPGFGDESSRGGFERFTLRGFFAADSTFLDGLRADPRFWVNHEVFGLERIEVLKGAGLGALRPGRARRHRESRQQTPAPRGALPAWIHRRQLRVPRGDR